MPGEVMLRHPLFLDWGNVVCDLCPLSHEGATSRSLSAGETHGIATIGTQLYYLVTTQFHVMAEMELMRKKWF